MKLMQQRLEEERKITISIDIYKNVIFFIYDYSEKIYVMKEIADNSMSKIFISMGT